MKILRIDANGGTCNRCGKCLVNVATISINGKTQTVGLDCLQKVEIKDFETKAQLARGVKDAKELGSIKRLVKNDQLETKVIINPLDDKIYYWKKVGTYKWNWFGLECQNKTPLRKQAWDLITDHEKGR